MNETRKYIVSSTLGSADWSNSTILGSYSADAIRSLKERVDGGIYVSASGTLVRAMLADRLVDELHLFVFPLAKAPAGDSSPKAPVRPGLSSQVAKSWTMAPSI
jgi:dihydrofolate reductase